MSRKLIPIEVRRILPKDTQAAWEHLVSLLPTSAYLVGGTAVATHLLHRISRDLDFFLSSPVDLDALHENLLNCGRPWVATTKTDTTLNGLLGETKIQFLLADQETIIEPCSIIGGLPIASLPDLMAMKLGVVTRRGALRDYLDLMQIEKQTNLSVEDGISLFLTRYHPVGIDNAVSSIVLALGEAGLADADIDPAGVSKSEVKELKRYWPRRQLELARHLSRLETSKARDSRVQRSVPPLTVLEAIDRRRRQTLCNAWMPRAKAHCVLTAGHYPKTPHRSAV